jgi:hypothetical protein
MIRQHSFSNEPAFKALQDLVRDALCTVLDTDWPKAIEVLTAGKSVDLRDDLELMIRIENHLFELLENQKDTWDIESFQFPVNVRIVHSTPPDGYLARPFATDHMHCDVWSDAPSDSSNFFLYLFTVGDCSALKIYESIQNDPYSRNYRGPYVNFDGDLSELAEIPSEIEEGVLYAFDTYSPHKTVRGTDGIRISIDFRTRSGVPYNLEGRPADPDKFSSYSPGVPGPGIYWSRQNRRMMSFSDKCEYELEQAKNIGDWAVSLRQAYIEKTTSQGVFT